jgi:hypothetical protein
MRNLVVCLCGISTTKLKTAGENLVYVHLEVEFLPDSGQITDQNTLQGSIA